MIATRKAQLLDVVEMLEDLPEFGIKRGERGAVVEVFDEPEEAYIVEFVDESGKSRIADWVKPSQIATIDELAKESYERGMALLNQGKPFDAEQEFRQAFERQPGYIGVLHNSIIEFHKSATKGIGSLEELSSLVEALRFVLRLNPNYEIARDNIAVVYLNYGVRQANEGNTEAALEFYYLAVGIKANEEVTSCLKRNFSAAYTSLGIQWQQQKEYEKAVHFSRRACEVDPNEVTRFNLGVAYANLGWSDLNKGNLQNAGIFFEQAQMTGLAVPQLFNNYGIVLAAVGNLEGAIKALEHALKLAPEDQLARANLARIKEAKAKSEMVLGFHNQAIEIIETDMIPIPSVHPQAGLAYA